MNPKFGRRIRNLIAEFRGLPKDESRAVLRTAKPLGQMVSNLMKKIGTIKVRPEQVIQQNWETVVGPKFLKYCQPMKILSRDILIIQCANSVVRSELQVIKQKILGKLHELPHCAKISDIRFVANR